MDCESLDLADRRVTDVELERERESAKERNLRLGSQSNWRAGCYNMRGTRDM